MIKSTASECQAPWDPGLGWEAKQREKSVLPLPSGCPAWEHLWMMGKHVAGSMSLVLQPKCATCCLSTKPWAWVSVRFEPCRP